MRVNSEEDLEDGEVNSKKHHVKLDAGILVVTFMYYLIAQFKINPSYSSGYNGIWWFFTLEHLTLIGSQALLIAADIKRRKTLILSIRSCAFILVLGTSLISVFLGLPSPWLIIYFCIVQGMHVHLFMEGLNMRDDRYVFFPNMTEMVSIRRPVPQLDTS